MKTPWLRSLFLAPPRHDDLSLMRVVCGPLILYGILFLPWPHRPAIQMPTALVWSLFVLSGLAERLPMHRIYIAACLRAISSVGLLGALVWLLVV